MMYIELDCKQFAIMNWSCSMYEDYLAHCSHCFLWDCLMTWMANSWQIWQISSDACTGRILMQG